MAFKKIKIFTIYPSHVAVVPLDPLGLPQVWPLGNERERLAVTEEWAVDKQPTRCQLYTSL